MVCKINFDFEVLLSDDDDSISSPIFSSDEDSFRKKFVLGDNIRNVHPLEIFSVRQFNEFTMPNIHDFLPADDSATFSNNSTSHQVPMNHYPHYDESISDFDEESVTESEYDFHSMSPVVPDKQFQPSPAQLVYHLPTVSRFQIASAAPEPATNISALSQSCLKEKQKRSQIGKSWPLSLLISGLKCVISYEDGQRRSTDDCWQGGFMDCHCFCGDVGHCSGLSRFLLCIIMG